MPRAKPFRIGGVTVPLGTSRDIRLKVSERYTGDDITLPIRVIRGKKDGPRLFVTAAIHGDELNGVGVIHSLMVEDPPALRRGTLVLVPVVNVLGFEDHQRYMPDRRDLNRSFPGNRTGSMASRVAATIFEEIVQRCEWGIDLHTAAWGRTNYPNVRADFANARVRRLARAFGCELMLNTRGPDKSFRREAVKAGCAVIAVEAGEPFKIEPGVLDVGRRGVLNALGFLGMIDAEPVKPTYQSKIDKSLWVRAEVGGILRFHIAPGDFVERGQAVATNASAFGEAQNVLYCPVDGVVLGMTTLPAVKPGEPVCHIAVPGRSLRALRRAFGKTEPDDPYRRMREDLATSVTVSEHEEEPAPDTTNDTD